jgi:hypothetical protein
VALRQLLLDLRARDPELVILRAGQR